MKSVSLLVLLLLGWLNSLCWASEANEDLTRSLVVVRLINQVKWLPENFKKKSADVYQLCIFDDTRTFRVFKQNLSDIEIDELSVNVKNVTEKDDLSQCHATYIPKASRSTIDYLVKNNPKNKTILVTEKKDFDENDGHINLFLNEDGFFDFQLNPEAFGVSGHDINPELFALGQVIKGDSSQKAKTLRTLINNTEWVNNKAFTNEFKLCAYPNNSFATFTNYFLAESDLKGLKVALNTIKLSDSVKTLQNCNALLLSDNDEPHLYWLMKHRKELGTLLINNGIDSEGNGAHYSLRLKGEPHSRKFGINLLAFAITGHVPNYQLLNSAIIFKNDYPTVGEVLTQIIASTNLSNKSNSAIEDNTNLNFCNYQDELSFDRLKNYMLTNLADNKKLSFFQLREKLGEVKCDVIFAGELDTTQNGYLPLKKYYPRALLITNQLTSLEKITYQSIIHFNLSLKPKEVVVEAYLKNIKASGFLLDQKLMHTVIIIGGDSND